MTDGIPKRGSLSVLRRHKPIGCLIFATPQRQISNKFRQKASFDMWEKHFLKRFSKFAWLKICRTVIPQSQVAIAYWLMWKTKMREEEQGRNHWGQESWGDKLPLQTLIPRHLRGPDHVINRNAPTPPLRRPFLITNPRRPATSETYSIRTLRISSVWRIEVKRLFSE